MVTVYGARSIAEAMIARVSQMHERILGTTPSGEAYSASDPDLLKLGTCHRSFWISTGLSQLRASVVPGRARSLLCGGSPGGRLYGVTRTAASEAEVEALFKRGGAAD